MDLLTRINQVLSRRWTQAPDRSSIGMPDYYGKTPRLDSVRVIASHCANTELKLYSKKALRRDGDAAEAITEHEIYELLDNPCPTFPEIDGYTLRYMTFAYKILTGEAGWLKVRDGNRIIALLPIPKAWILDAPTVNRHYFTILPYGTMGGIQLKVEQKDFVWFKDVDLNDPYARGKGFAECLTDEIESDEYAAKYQKNFFFNDATPPYVVTGFQGNQDGADRVKQGLMGKLSGFMHAREPAVLTGSMDIKELGVSPKELDFVESRKFLRDECLQHFQLPPEIMGILENSNRSTIDASFYLMQKNVLPQYLGSFERTINRQLLNEFDSDLICKHVLKVDEDEQLQLQIYQFGVANGCITREQFCEKFGINPAPKDGTYIVPATMVLQNAGEIELPETEPEALPIDDDKPDENGKSATKYQIMKQIENQQWKLKVWTMFDEKAKSKESGFISKIKKVAERQREDLEPLIRKAVKENKPVENVIENYFGAKVDEAVKQSLAGAWIDSLRGGRDNAKVVLGRKENADEVILNQAFNKWIETYGLSKSVLINDTTKKELLKKLQSILQESEGEGVDILADKLVKGSAEVFDELTKVRALMIARTETGAAVNMGQNTTYKVYGIERKVWLSTMDNRTRLTHFYMNEVEAGIDETFTVEMEEGGTEELMYPLDPNGSAGNVINCRCTIYPKVE